MSNLEKMLNTWDESDNELNKKIDNTNLSTIVASATASAVNSKVIEINGTGKAVEKLIVEGKTVQDGTPTPSAPVEVKGVGDYVGNIFDKTKVVNGYGYVANDKTLGTNASLCYEYISIEPTMKSITITGQKNLNSTTFANAFLDADKKYISIINLKNSTDDVTINIPNNARFIVITAFKDESVYELDTIKVIVNKYKIPISVGDTTKNVYLDAPLFDGDKADLAGGTVDKKYGMVALADLAWGTSGSGGFHFANLINAKMPYNGNTATNAICTHYVAKAYTPIVTGDTAFALYDNKIYIPNHSGTVPAPTEGYLVYELATPTKETFDGAELPVTVGKNTLALSTEVTPTRIEAITFGDYYLKAEVDKKIDKLDDTLRAKVDKSNVPVKIKTETGNLALQIALNYMYPDATDFKMFLVSITYDDGNYYLGYFRYKKNVSPNVIDIGKSSGITAVNVNQGGTISPAGVTGTPHFSIIGLS